MSRVVSQLFRSCDVEALQFQISGGDVALVSTRKELGFE